MNRIKKFNESQEDDSLIEDIRNICLPLIDNGFIFEPHSNKNQLNHRWYNFTLRIHYSESHEIKISFSDERRNDNEEKMESLLLKSEKLKSISNHILEIGDRLSDYNKQKYSCGSLIIVDENRGFYIYFTIEKIINNIIK